MLFSIHQNFLPRPQLQLQQQIASDFCEDTSPATFEEAGCAVCGKLAV